MGDDVKQLISEIGILLFLGAGAIFMATLLIKELKKRKKDYENLDKPIKKASTKRVKATVINKYADAVYEGSVKYPKHRIGYFITFKTEDGKEITYDVGEKVFNRVYAYTTGDLAISDGKFLDFR